jgi:ribosomal protein L29
MKKADKQTIQTKSVKELQDLIAAARKNLEQIKFDHVQGKLKNTRSIFTTRKELAVLQSVLQGKLTEKEGEQK